MLQQFYFKFLTYKMHVNTETFFKSFELMKFKRTYMYSFNLFKGGGGSHHLIVKVFWLMPSEIKKFVLCYSYYTRTILSILWYPSFTSLFINKSASNKQRNIKKCIINKVITLITADDLISEVIQEHVEFFHWRIP